MIEFARRAPSTLITIGALAITAGLILRAESKQAETGTTT